MRRYNSKPQTRMTAAHTRHIWAWPRGHMGMGTSIRHRWTYEDVPPCSHCVQPVTTHSSTRIDTERCTLAQTLKPLLSRLSLSLSLCRSFALPPSELFSSLSSSLAPSLPSARREGHAHESRTYTYAPRSVPAAPVDLLPPPKAVQQHVASTSPARRHRPDTSVRLLTPPACVLLLASSPQCQAPRPPWQASQTHPSGRRSALGGRAGGQTFARPVHDALRPRMAERPRSVATRCRSCCAVVSCWLVSCWLVALARTLAPSLCSRSFCSVRRA